MGSKKSIYTLDKHQLKEILLPYSAKFKVSIDEIRCKSRVEKLNFIRCIIVNDLKNEYTLEAVGWILNRHHSTVMHQIENYKILITHREFLEYYKQ